MTMIISSNVWVLHIYDVGVLIQKLAIIFLFLNPTTFRLTQSNKVWVLRISIKIQNRAAILLLEIFLTQYHFV